MWNRCQRRESRPHTQHGPNLQAHIPNPAPAPQVQPGTEAPSEPR